MKKADIGLIGLAVMGENLAMNMESHGFTVAVYNRSTEKVDKFLSGRGAQKNFIGCRSPEELIDSLKKPRRIFMMVKAGAAVDALIAQLLPLLDEGDILIDGGNSHYPDTVRRTAQVESRGCLYIGCGVSGGPALDEFVHLVRAAVVDGDGEAVRLHIHRQIFAHDGEADQTDICFFHNHSPYRLPPRGKLSA